MWILRSSSASPFGRKVSIGAALCGFSHRIKVQASNPSHTSDSIVAHDPLVKIPTLVLADGPVAQAGGGVITPDGDERLRALTLQATADGIMDANVLIVAEGRFRPGGKGEPGAPRLGGAPTGPERRGPCRPHRTCLRAGLPRFRFGADWRESHPRLVSWLQTFEPALPICAATQPH